MLVPLKVWAEKNGLAHSTARLKAGREMIPAKKMGRDWFIADNAPNIDHRCNGLSKRWKGEKDGKL